MDKELLSFVIETLLLKPQPLMGLAVTPIPGCSVAQPLQSSDQDVVRDHAGAMRDLIAERVASNAGVIADTLVELIKGNARIQPDVVFELCDEVVKLYQLVPIVHATSIDPKLCGALRTILSFCNCSFTLPVQNTYRDAPTMPQQPIQQPVYSQSKDVPWTYNDPSMVYTNQLTNLTTNLKLSVEAFIQAILSTKEYSPLTVLHNSKSKVVILHDSPYKDQLRAIADEKNMIVLTDTSAESDPIPPYSNHFRPELGLLLMINAYNSTSVDNAILFPGRNKNNVYAVHEWTSIDNYLVIEKYINDTDGIGDELSRKAPEFFKDFADDLTVIHRDYIGDSINS